MEELDPTAIETIVNIEAFIETQAVVAQLKRVYEKWDMLWSPLAEICLTTVLWDQLFGNEAN